MTDLAQQPNHPQIITEPLPAPTPVPGDIVTVRGIQGGPLSVKTVTRDDDMMTLLVVDSENCEIKITAPFNTYKIEYHPKGTDLGPCGMC